MAPGEVFNVSWTIRNVGTVPWVGRRLERQGPLVGPGLIASPRYVPIPDAEPSTEATILATLKISAILYSTVFELVALCLKP